ncbi:MAG TPA: phage holin family protein [Polyangiaceae bacterium]
MAIVSALLAWIGNRLGSLVQAVLGWSVTALFGRLPSTKQTALAGALLLSLAWPVVVVGVFVPAVSAWGIAFVPVHKWVGAGLVRWITLGLAIVLPWVVGAVTRWVAPPQAKSTFLRTLLSGYALTVGYAVACIVTAVTVPLVKAASALRGWDDQHVFVQPRAGEYRHALEELHRACEAAGIRAAIVAIPGRMLIATRVLRWFARSALDPIVAEDPRMIRGDELEVYLYPGDLLLRGKKDRVARVRATMTRSWLERYAFLVSDPEAQKLEDELQRMWAIFQRHADRSEIGGQAYARLREIAHDLDRTTLPYEDWVALDRSLHRVERALAAGGDILHDDIAVESVIGPRKEARKHMPAVVRETAEPTGELVREAIDEIRELVQLEVALAVDGAKGDLAKAKTAGVSLGAAAALAICAITMFFVALAAAFIPMWLAALVVGGGLLLVAAVLAAVGWRALPRKPLAETRARLESDVKQLRERIA